MTVTSGGGKSTTRSNIGYRATHSLGCRKTYQDPKGIQRTWESAERRTRPKGSDIDGVGIVAILESETGM